MSSRAPRALCFPAIPTCGWGQSGAPLARSPHASAADEEHQQESRTAGAGGCDRSICGGSVIVPVAATDCSADLTLQERPPAGRGQCSQLGWLRCLCLYTSPMPWADKTLDRRRQAEVLKFSLISHFIQFLLRAQFCIDPVRLHAIHSTAKTEVAPGIQSGPRIRRSARSASSTRTRPRA
jgi:hypothetical protein